jgi:actin-like ATPase involved in cell morphogenesis
VAASVAVGAEAKNMLPYVRTSPQSAEHGVIADFEKMLQHFIQRQGAPVSLLSVERS